MLVRAVKFLIICFFALAPLVFMVITGCATSGIPREKAQGCLEDQIRLYGDLCAEGVDTHPSLEEPFRTMLCGLQGAAICMDLDEPQE